MIKFENSHSEFFVREREKNVVAFNAYWNSQNKRLYFEISFADPTFDSSQFSRYRAQLPIFGNVGQSGYSVILDQGSSDLFPTNYFTLESVNGQDTYIRLINAIDRDVSSELHVYDCLIVCNGF